MVLVHEQRGDGVDSELASKLKAASAEIPGCQPRLRYSARASATTSSSRRRGRVRARYTPRRSRKSGLTRAKITGQVFFSGAAGGRPLRPGKPFFWAGM